MREQVLTSLDQAHALFLAEAAGLPCEWAAVQDMPAQALACLSRGADLILAGGRPLASGDRYRNADPAELMLLAGRPVLVESCGVTPWSSPGRTRASPAAPW